MIIAIYHCQDIHFEMLGYILEYCLKYNFLCHIYQRPKYKDKTHVVSNSYLEWYSHHFNDSKHLIRVIFNYHIVEEVDYDVIFLPTDDALEFPYIRKYKDKIIAIDHFGRLRNSDVAINIGTRNFEDRPNIPYAIPCFNVISEYNKRNIIKDLTRVQVVFIGRFNIPSSKTFSLFNNFSDIDFHIVRWKNIEPDYFKFLKKLPNIYFHSIESNDDLIETLTNAHYCFFHPMYILGYHNLSLSGVLHYALSCLVKCIIPLTWNISLKFTSFLIYDDLILSSPNQQLQISVDDYMNSIESINIERFNCIKHRNDMFDNAITKITNMVPVLKINNSYISQTLFNSCFMKPKLLITTGDVLENDLSLLKNDFREVISINEDINFVNLFKFIYKRISNINIQYDPDTIKILSDNIKNNESEPILFFLEPSNQNLELMNKQLIKELSIIRTSKNDDNIIFIKNFRILTDENAYFLYRQNKLRFLNLETIFRTYNNKKYKVIILDEDHGNGILIIPEYDQIFKKVFQVCIKPYNYQKIPPFVMTNIKNKTVNYEYSLHTDKVVFHNLSCFSDNIMKKYNYFHYPQNKKDFYQLQYLYTNGGMYIDLDQEQIVQLEDVVLDATFISMVPLDKESGLCIGFMGATKYNPIVKDIFNTIGLYLCKNELSYTELCEISGNVLKEFMGVLELYEGVYEIKGQKIILLQEIWDEPGNIKTCRGVLDGKTILNTRYPDYPWNLRG
jgi:hypothetical protein